MTDQNRKSSVSENGFCVSDSDVYSSVEKYLGNGDADIGQKKSTLISLQKTLGSLSPERKSEFISKGLNTFLNSLLPTLLVSDRELKVVAVNVVSDILPDLLKLNYSANPKWTVFLEKLNVNKSFTDDMCEMIKENDTNWSALWKLSVKLIGNQLHKGGSLINSLLHVLENAFRAPNENRAKAFECWNVLIENFSTNPEKMLSYSRIKLLCVPLALNNVKSEEIAIVKHETWWFLVRTVHLKAPVHWKFVLLQYLKFCFGEAGTETSPSCVAYPGLVYPEVMKLAVKALVEIMGHSEECAGRCVQQFPRLDKPVIDLEAFKTVYANLFHCIKIAVPVMSPESAGCLWNSCVSLSVKCLNENEYLVKTILGILKFWIDVKCFGDAEFCSSLVKVIFPKLFVAEILDSSVILDSMFSDKNIITVPFQALATMISSSLLYHGSSADDKIALMKNFIDSGFCQCGDVNNFCLKILNSWDDQENQCIFWKCLAEEIVRINNANLSYDVYKSVLIWPIKSAVNYDTAVDFSLSWQVLYGHAKKMFQETPPPESIEDRILECTTKHCKEPSVVLIFLCAVLKQCLKDYSGGSLKTFKMPLETMLNLLRHINDKNVMADLGIPIVLNVSSVVGSVISNIASGRRIEPVYLHLLQQSAKSVVSVSSCVFHKVESLKSYEKEVGTFLSNMNNFLLPAFCQQTSHHVIDVLSLFLNKCDQSSAVFAKAMQILKTLQCNENLAKEDIVSVKKLLQDRQKNFSSPAPVKPSPETRKKTPLKRTDSEEFVVIQPTWKFDPRKLTEHQAEMMKRRREDIPALYGEDLSQSQDSHIKAWKPPGYKSDNSHGDNSFSQLSDSIGIDKNNKENANNKPPEESKSLVSSPTTNKNPETPKRDKARLSIRSKITNSLKKLNPVSANNEEKDEKVVYSPASDVERPSRLKRKPVKFSPDDQDKSSKKREGSPNTMPSPRSTKRKSRLFRQLSIDTVEGHPSKELTEMELNARSTRKRKLEEPECPKSKDMKKSSDLVDPDYNELREVEMFLEQSSNSQESEDVIASSQDSSFSVKTPRRFKYKKQNSLNDNTKKEPEVVMVENNAESTDLPQKKIESDPLENNEESPKTDLSSQEIREAETEIMDVSEEKQESPLETTPEKKICSNSSIAASPYENDHEKTLELLNNTMDISPIKPSALITDPDPEPISSPDKPDTSLPDEPPTVKESATSPELFCSEKLSSPKQNSSPPRSARSVMSNPSLSKMKNRGRGAHMIGLCLLETESIKHSGVEDAKDVCKNLQNIYNATENDVNMEDEPVLEFNKLLPSPFASPAVPILKKLDDTHLSSPTSKKKRVSFHDPPVSTTVNIQKYIEPECNIRSPQQVTIKNYRNRINKPLAAKSLIKKMDIEASNPEEVAIATPPMENDSIVIDSPQIVDITKNCLLDDRVPIYPQLCLSEASIREIASELSSPCLRDLFLKDIEVKTVGDLASMTELQINRLPIKSPKLETVIKVLTTFEKNMQTKVEVDKVETKDSFTECELKNYADFGSQTEELPKSLPECLALYRNNKSSEEIEKDMVQISEESLDVFKIFASTCPDKYMEIAASSSAISSSSILDKLPTLDILKYINTKMKDDLEIRSEVRSLFGDIEKEITEEVKQKYSAKTKHLISIQNQLDDFIKNINH